MTEVVVVGNTRMGGNNICMSVYDPSSRHYLRPLHQSTVPQDRNWTENDIRKKMLIPFTKHTLQYRSPRRVEIPHSEDCYYVQSRLISTMKVCEIINFLEAISSLSISGIYGMVPDAGRCFSKNIPRLSLGTLKDARSVRIKYEEHKFRPGDDNFRIDFTDSSEYSISKAPIADVRLRNYLVWRRNKCGQSHAQVENDINSVVANSDVLFIRVGLSRKYQPPDNPDGYWLEVTGIYPFPDYTGDNPEYDFWTYTP